MNNSGKLVLQKSSAQLNSPVNLIVYISSSSFLYPPS